MELQKSVCLSGEQLLNVCPEMPNLFQALEEGRPAGTLTLFCPDPDTAEVSAYVPEPRRNRGVFTTLLAAAAEEAASYGFQRLLFPCGGQSSLGQAVAAHWGLALDHREYLMFHTGPRPAPAPGLDLRQEADERGFPRLTLWQGERPAGSAFVNPAGETASIFGLEVPEDLRGRGWGGKLMAALLSALPAGRPVTLEVDAANTPALRLYTACGFTVRHQVDYYVRPLSPSAGQSGG